MTRPGMVWKLLIFSVLNLFDLATTLWGLNAGVVNELNPILRWAYQISPWMFVAIKTLTFVCFSAVLWVDRHELRAHKIAWLAIFFFTALCTWQAMVFFFLIKNGILP